MEAILCTDWRELSRAASQEQDPTRLMELVAELNRVLEHRENMARQRLQRDPLAA